MKKLLFTMLTILMLLSFVGCCVPYNTDSSLNSDSSYGQIIMFDESYLQNSGDATVSNFDTNPSEKTNSEVNESSLTLDVVKNQIVGTWSYAYRDEYIRTSGYTFNADGTYSMYYRNYMPKSQLYEDPSATGWEIVPMGYPADSGTYEIESVNNDVIIITLYCTFNGFENVSPATTSEIIVYKFNGYTMEISPNNQSGKIHFKEDSFDGICKAFNIDTTA